MSEVLMYKGVMVGSGELHTAIKEKKNPSAVFAATTARYEKMYSEEDRKWFEYMSRNLNKRHHETDQEE